MPVEFAFVGAGGIASRHLAYLEDRDDASVVAICDIVEEVAERAARPHGAATYTDYRDLFEEESFDAVVVAVPPFAHENQELLAAEHGVDLFVEKPLALDGATAERNAKAVEEAGILTQVGHMDRYSEAVRRATELIGDRTLALIDARWWCGVPGDEDHWWRVKAKSGGQIVEQATHTYDLVRYFAGDVETVYATGGKRVRVEELDFEDSTSASMRHENGVTSHVSATSASPTGDRGFQLVGDGFQLSLDPAAGTLSGVVDGEEIDFEGSSERYEPEMDAFVEAVETRDDAGLLSPYADARKTFETTLAAERSLASGAAEEVGR